MVRDRALRCRSAGNALLIKIAVLLYAHRQPVATPHTRLFVWLVFVLAIQNIAEISIFGSLSGAFGQGRKAIPAFEGYVYFAVSTIALALLLHLALELAYGSSIGRARIAAAIAYGGAVVLEALLLFTPLVVEGFRPFAYSISRIPGPLYPIWETYAVTTFLGALTLLVHGARRQSTPTRRLRCRYMLLGIVPVIALVMTTIVLLRGSNAQFNSLVTLPIVMTFLLAVTAYATHQHRLFEIEFYLPWSKVRERKTAFYARIQATIAEVEGLRSPREVIRLLADTLECSVAFVGGRRPMLATAQGEGQSSCESETATLANFPRETLAKIDRIVVAQEIAEAAPETHALMKQHHVGAVVPFHPHRDGAAHWMLLGECFSERVYTPLDFKRVEWLFSRLGERYLDQVLLVRAQLKNALQDLRDYHRRLATALDEAKDLHKKLEASEAENSRLREHNATFLHKRFTITESTRPTPTITPCKTLEEYLNEYEAYIIKQALDYCHGHRSETAQLLGLRPNTLHYKIRRLGIDETGY